MTARLATLLLAVLALAGFAPIGRAAHAARAAQEPSQPARTTDGSNAADASVGATTNELDRARGRWEKLTPEERRALLERYRTFRDLGPQEQHALVERARRVRESVQRLTNELGPDVREKLRDMDPARRREAVRELVTDEARGKGLELRARLPDAWAERLEQATPEERPAILEEFRRRHLNRLANFAIERLGKELGLPREEIDARIKLPFEKRAAIVLEMRKDVQAHDANENGLPPGISAQDWQELQRLPAERFYERMQNYRTQRIADQAAREARGEPRDGELRTGEPRDGQPRFGDPREGDPRLGPPDGRGRHRGPPPLESLRQLREALRPDPRDVVSLMDLPPEERARRLFELRRDRCLAVVRVLDLAPPQRVDELRDMPEPAFVLAMRRLLGPLHAAERGLPPPQDGPPRGAPGPLGPPDGAHDRGGPPERGGAPPREGPPAGPDRQGPPPNREGPRRDDRGAQDAARLVPGLHDGGIA